MRILIFHEVFVMTSCPVNLKGGASAHLQRVHMIFKYSGISYELVDMMK